MLASDGTSDRTIKAPQEEIIRKSKKDELKTTPRYLLLLSASDLIIEYEQTKGAHTKSASYE